MKGKKNLQFYYTGGVKERLLLLALYSEKFVVLSVKSITKNSSVVIIGKIKKGAFLKHTFKNAFF
jgi:hypothetical protein